MANSFLPYDPRSQPGHTPLLEGIKKKLEEDNLIREYAQRNKLPNADKILWGMEDKQRQEMLQKIASESVGPNPRGLGPDGVPYRTMEIRNEPDRSVSGIAERYMSEFPSGGKAQPLPQPPSTPPVQQLAAPSQPQVQPQAPAVQAPPAKPPSGPIGGLTRVDGGSLIGERGQRGSAYAGASSERPALGAYSLDSVEATMRGEEGGMSRDDPRFASGVNIITQRAREAHAQRMAEQRDRASESQDRYLMKSDPRAMNTSTTHRYLRDGAGTIRRLYDVETGQTAGERAQMYASQGIDPDAGSAGLTGAQRHKRANFRSGRPESKRERKAKEKRRQERRQDAREGRLLDFEKGKAVLEARTRAGEARAKLQGEKAGARADYLTGILDAQGKKYEVDAAGDIGKLQSETSIAKALIENPQGELTPAQINKNRGDWSKVYENVSRDLRDKPWKRNKMWSEDAVKQLESPAGRAWKANYNAQTPSSGDYDADYMTMLDAWVEQYNASKQI